MSLQKNRLALKAFVDSTWFALVIYMGLALAAYALYFDNPFMMDDELLITNNSAVQNLKLWTTYFSSSTMDTGGMGSMGGIYFRPLVTLYYALIWALAGPSAVAFRVPIFVLHVINGYLVFIFLKRYFRKSAAFAAGLVFILHPANSEVVAYIADAQDVLYLFFGLAALVLATARPVRVSRVTQYIGVAVLLAASLASKETGALFCIGIPLHQWSVEPKARRAFWGSLIASLSVLLAYAALRLSTGLTSYHSPALILHRASLIERLTTTPLILWHYIEIFFLPWRISMVTDFFVNEIDFENFWLPLLGDLATLVIFFSIPYRLRHKAPAHYFRLALFSLTLLGLWFGLHGNAILPLDGTYADRWLYFAFLPALTLILLNLPAQIWSHKLMRAAVCAIAVIFFARTVVRLQDWSIPQNFYARELALHPWDYVMANNVGVEMFKSGHVLDARPYFLQATKINPVWDVGWNNLGASFERTGNLNQALEYYKKAVSLGTYALAYENLAGLLCSPAAFGRTGETSSDCTQFLAKARALFPYNQKLRDIEERRKM